METAKRLNIKGWIMVTKRGKVMGHIQGENNKVDEMYVLKFHVIISTR